MQACMVFVCYFLEKGGNFHAAFHADVILYLRCLFHHSCWHEQVNILEGGNKHA